MTSTVKILIFSCAGLAAAAYFANSQEDKTPAPKDPAPAQAATPTPEKCEHCELPAPAVGSAVTIKADLEIPNIELLDQDGRKLNVYEDLVEGKTLAMNFIFTTCKTICPPMGANFGQLSKLVEKSGNPHLSLVSVSIDPVADTPGRLKAWSKKFDGGSRWTLLTGPKQEVDRLLKSLEVFTPNKTDHAPFVLIGNASGGEWTRLNGFEAPEKVCAKMLEIDARARSAAPASAPPDKPAESEAKAAAREYFTDLVLTDQHGKPQRFYSDLIEGRTVVMHSFFTSCTGACPVIIEKVSKACERHRDELGKELQIISVTVDPEVDTPAKLAKYAEGLDAGEGWYFLTGSKAQVDTALQKIGHFTREKESHSNFVIIMNEKTGLMKKAFGLDPKLDLVKVVGEVLRDDG